MTWQVGDRCYYDGNSEPCAVCQSDEEEAEDSGHINGDILTVLAVYPPVPSLGFPNYGLGFASDVPPDGWCECSYRKIAPDEHEACEPEFVTLLKRTKRTVRA